MKTIFIVIGYELKLDDGRLSNSVQFEVYANNEKEAIDKAKKYVKCKEYRVSNVIEK